LDFVLSFLELVLFLTLNFFLTGGGGLCISDYLEYHFKISANVKLHVPFYFCRHLVGKTRSIFAI